MFHSTPPMLPLLTTTILLLLTPSSATPTLTVTPTTLKRSGDVVTISWSDISAPSSLDWLGIYISPSSTYDQFIGYIFLNTSSTWQSGSGSISIPLTNHRSNYTFRIFHWTDLKLRHDPVPLPSTTDLMAESETVVFASGQGPEQVHLSFTDVDTEMRVMFLGEDEEERFIRFGKSEDDLDEKVVPRVVRYEVEDLCDAPANSSVGWRDPGWIFDGVLQDLEKGVRYYYQVGSDSKGWSKIFSFVSRNEDSDETVAFLFGDMGTATPYRTFIRTQDESVSTVKWLLRDIKELGDKPAFISHVGDISYARGYSWLWDQFFAQVEPLASQVAYHVCIGNHEYDWPLQPWKPDWAKWVYKQDGGGECGVPYSLKLHMPGNSSEPTGSRAPATRNLYYSFDMGSVHFVYMSTETNFLKGSNQYNFLKQDLESVDRKKTPFVVVQGHRPMYTTSIGHKDYPLRNKMLEHLEPLFVKNKVTIAFWGHVHRYERYCPLNNFTCGSLDQNGDKAYPVHIVIGMAGQDWQPIWSRLPNHPTDPIFPQPKRSMYRGGEFGYTRLLANKKKLVLSYVGNHDGEVHDRVEIMAPGDDLNKVVATGRKDHPGGRVTVTIADSRFSWYAKGASVLVVGAFLGFFLGYTRKADPTFANTWTPVKTVET